MKTKFRLLFYLKKRNNYQSGNVPVYLRITVQGERSEVGISRNIDPVNWDLRKERARGNKDEAIELNRHIESISTKLKGIQSRLETEEVPYSAEELKDEFLGRGSSAKLLLEVLLEHNEEMENEIGKENGFSANTLKTWKSTHSHLKQFIAQKYKMEDIQIRKVDVNFINEYRKFLRNTRKCIPISADKYVYFSESIHPVSFQTVQPDQGFLFLAASHPAGSIAA